MGFFDDMYDKMKWKEVCVRLPSELAVNAIKRRVTNLTTIGMLFENSAGHRNASHISELKDHVNSILDKESTDDILREFSDQQRVLFNWLSKENIERLRNADVDKLDMKLLFNLTGSNDESGLVGIMQKVLDTDEVDQAHIRSVLRKANSTCLQPLLDMIASDKRPEVRANLIAVPGLTNSGSVSDMQLIIGLKAFAKCEDVSPVRAVNRIGIYPFSQLRAVERLVALERYLGYFPKYKRINVFDPVPTDDEINMILFSGCLSNYDKTIELKEIYKQITQMDPPVDCDDEGV